MLKSQDIIKIAKVNLSGEDNYVLSQMYLPLIGMVSFSAYHLINNIKESETTVRRLIDVLGLANINSFDQALLRLEGIGLLKRYENEKKDRTIILECLLPLSQKSFLSNSLLKEFLVSKIGDVEVHTLEKNLQCKKISGYEEVTKRFDEVFKTTNLKTKVSDYLEESVVDNIKIKNENFDYLIFKLSIDESLISKDVLDDEDFENNILKISYQYQLNEEEMKEAVTKAILINHDLKYEDVAKYAGYIFQNKGANQVLGFDVKEPLVYNHNLSSDEENLIVIADNSSISQMLESLSGGQPALSEVNDYIKLANLTGLPQGVINILALYINQNKEGDNVSFNYIEKVARNWMKKGVKTTIDAVKLLNENKEKSKVKNKGKNKKQVEEPEWMKRDDQEKEKIIKQEMTLEEIEEANKLAKKLLG